VTPAFGSAVHCCISLVSCAEQSRTLIAQWGVQLRASQRLGLDLADGAGTQQAQ
jgi:hypothetical protein